MPGVFEMSHCATLASAATGMNTIPAPSVVSGDRRITPSALRIIWPARRPRTMGSSGTRFQRVVRISAISTSTATASSSMVMTGFSPRLVSTCDAPATMPQNAEVTRSDPTSGMAELLSRVSRCHVMGLLQRSLVFGPEGPA